MGQLLLLNFFWSILKFFFPVFHSLKHNLSAFYYARTTSPNILLSWLLFSHSVVSNSFATPWTVAHQTLLSMVFPRQEYWSELPFPSPGNPPNPGITPTSPAHVPCIGRQILYHWTTREALIISNQLCHQNDYSFRVTVNRKRLQQRLSLAFVSILQFKKWNFYWKKPFVNLVPC